MTERTCAHCDHPIIEPLVETDVPVVCFECYHNSTDEHGFAGSELPRSARGVCPDLYAVARADSSETKP